MLQIIAVDFGGTNIRVAYFPTAKPPPKKQSKSPTHASEGPEAVIARLIVAIQAMIPKKHESLRIGVGSPGPLDPVRGIIYNAVNLPGWVNIPLKEKLETHFSCPVDVGNDANLAALGEWRFGAGRGTNNLVYLTISTGIGGGVIIDGRLLVGAQGLGAEVGHITVEPGGPVCGCGQHGHLEAVAAGPAIARRAMELLEAGRSSILNEKLETAEPLTSADVGKAANQGDTLAREIIEYAGEKIGRAMADLAHLFNPEIFILGGGVSQIGPLLFESVERALRSYVMDSAYVEDLRVLPAALGDDAGLIGAMVLASQG
jgi:glucokinase